MLMRHLKHSPSLSQKMSPIGQLLSKLHQSHAPPDGLLDRLGIAAALLLVAARVGDPVQPQVDLLRGTRVGARCKAARWRLLSGRHAHEDVLSAKACCEAQAVLVTYMGSMVDPKHRGQMGLSSPDRGNLQHGLLYSPWPACEHPMECPLLQDVALLAAQQPSCTTSGATSPWQLMDLVRHRRFWLTHDSTAHGRPCRSSAQSWPAEPCPARPWQPVLPPRAAVPGPDGLQWLRPGCSLCRACSWC